MVGACLSNIDSWIDAASEIAEHATPTNKARALNLERNLRQAKESLRRLAKLPEEPGG